MVMPGSENNPARNDKLDVHSRCVVSATVMIANVAAKWPLQSFALEQSVFDHHLLVLEFALDIEAANEAKEFVSTSQFQDAMGKSVSLKITPADEYVDAAEALEFLGIITNIHFSNSGGEMNRIIFEALSPTILTDQASGFCFHDNMTFEDVIRTTLGQYSIDTGAISISGAATRDFWAKWGLTDWEYITTGLRTYPSWVFYDGKKLIIEERKSRNTHKLMWQKHVGSADLKMNATGFKHINYTWNELEKKEIRKDQTSPATQFSGLAQKAYRSSQDVCNRTSTALVPLRGDAKAQELDLRPSQHNLIRGISFDMVTPSKSYGRDESNQPGIIFVG